MKSELIDMTEFARRVGVTRQRIGQLLGHGRLPYRTAKGRRLIPWSEGKAAWDEYHGFEEAAPPPDAAAASDSPVEDAARPLQVSAESATLASAQRRKELARARLAELDLAEREGDLIPVEEVRADAVAVLSAIRASLLALPGLVSLRCEGKSAAEIDALLADHINGLLAEWHKGRWGA